MLVLKSNVSDVEVRPVGLQGLRCAEELSQAIRHIDVNLDES